MEIIHKLERYPVHERTFITQTVITTANRHFPETKTKTFMEAITNREAQLESEPSAHIRGPTEEDQSGFDWDSAADRVEQALLEPGQSHNG